MQVVHVSRAPDGRPAVWGERLDNAVAAAGDASAGGVHPHPFASPIDDLVAFVRSAAPTAVRSDAEFVDHVGTGATDGAVGLAPTTLELRLPTSDDDGHRPVASHAIAYGGRYRATPVGDGAPHVVGFGRWQVPAVVLSPPTLLAVVEGVSGLLPDRPLRDVDGADRSWFVGTVWKVLAAFAEHAMAMCAEGRVVPVVDHGRALWVPVMRPEARRRLEMLAAALPSSFTAAPPATVRPSEAADEILDSFCDAVTRSALHSQGWQPHLAAAQVSDHDALRLVVDLADASGACGTSTSTPQGTAVTSALAARRRQLQPARSALRACFRLVDPPSLDPDTGELDDASVTGRPEWRIEFLAQAAHDPSLMIDAAEIWAGGDRARLVAGTDHSPEAAGPDGSADGSAADLLSELDRAGRLVPRIADALVDPAPTGCTLGTSEVVEFLTHDLARLEAAGFAVLVPSWWAQRARSAGLRVRPKPPPGTAAGSGRPIERPLAGAGLGLASIVDVDWDFLLDGVALGPDDLALIADLKQPLVRVNGKWMFCTAEVRDAAVAFATGSAGLPSQFRLDQALALRADSHSGDPGDARTALLPELQGFADCDVEWRDSDAWRTSLGLSVSEHSDGAHDEGGPCVELPETFRGTLRPYQHRGVEWLQALETHGLGACLADDMGLGKTVQVLASMAVARAAGLDGPTLLVCPTSLIGNWVDESSRFTPELRVHVQHGPDRPRGDEFAAIAGDVDLVVTSYQLIARDAAGFTCVPWVRLVFDEAQNVKNPHAGQARALRTVAAGIPRRIALTGTPVENRLGELRSIMEILNPGLLGSEESFRHRFAVPIERHRDEAAAVRLAERVAPFVLRRTKSDRRIAPELPDKVERTERCELTAEQVSLYRAVVDELLSELPNDAGGEPRGSVRGDTASASERQDDAPPLTEMQRRGRVLAAIGKLKAVCNHPAQLTGDDDPLDGRSGKLERLEEVLEEVFAEGGRALVFTQFPTFGRRLREHLAKRFGVEVLFLHGGTSRTERDAMVARFQNGDRDGFFPAPPLFLLSLKAGGVGLNLTAASHVLHFDRWWNPAVESQATDRAYRIGQHRNVQVRTFVSSGTIEDRIDELINTKRDLADLVVGNVENWLTDLDADRIREMVSLDESPGGLAVPVGAEPEVSRER